MNGGDNRLDEVDVGFLLGGLAAVKDSMMSAFALSALWSDCTLWSDMAFLQANETNVKFIGLVHSLVDVHLRKNVASFRLVEGFADEALVR